MTLTVSQKIDTVVKSAQIMGIGIDELFLTEKDFDIVKKEAEKNNFIKDSEELDKLLYYQSTIGLIKLSKSKKI